MLNVSMGGPMTNRRSSLSNNKDIGRTEHLKMADYRLEYSCCCAGSLTSRDLGVPGSSVLCYCVTGHSRVFFVHSALLLVNKEDTP